MELNRFNELIHMSNMSSIDHGVMFNIFSKITFLALFMSFGLVKILVTYLCFTQVVVRHKGASLLKIKCVLDGEMGI